MKELPILFSAPMVRATIEDRKKVTRRTRGLDKINESPGMWSLLSSPAVDAACFRRYCGDGEWEETLAKCPYAPGDRLWVRECFSFEHCYMGIKPVEVIPYSSDVWYWADGNPSFGDWTKPKSSLFMPRWASRLTLEAVSVRAERLHDITEEDAIREGIIVAPPHIGIGWDGSPLESSTIDWAPSDYFRELWDSINGDQIVIPQTASLARRARMEKANAKRMSWAKNPWVWRVEYRKVTA